MIVILRLAAWAIVGEALACAGLALLAQGGRFSPSFDVFTHFAPLYFGAGVAGLLASLAIPQPFRAIGIAAAIVALAASGQLMAPELLRSLGRHAPPSGRVKIKVIQFNAWGGNRTPERAIAWLLAQDADVVVLEEGGRVQYELVRRGGYHLSCGNCFAAILSKEAPAWTNTPANWRIEPPVISMARFEAGRAEFTVLGVHRHWPNRPRVYEAEMAGLRDQVAALPRQRLIVAGDFNSTPWSFARRREDAQLGLTRRTLALFSWPAERVSHNRAPIPFPLLPIDHIYAGPGWTTLRTYHGPKLGSDHYPVVVEMEQAPS